MGNRTNSNSLVSITIDVLNNKTLGFRHEMLKKMGLKDGTIFEDGTHNSISEKGINNKEVDIVAKCGDKTAALIEVKVNVHEDLQPSQGKKGEYEKTARKNSLKLFYIIPEEYAHKEDLSDEGKIFTWEEILKMDSVKGTTYSNQIKNFAEINRYSSSNLVENVSCFTSILTSLLKDEEIYHEPQVLYNDRLQEHVTWYDLTNDSDGEEISIGISSDNGNVYLYVSSGFFDYVDSSKYGKLLSENKDSAYSLMFNLTEDADEDDLVSDSEFFEKFKKKICKFKKIAEDRL